MADALATGATTVGSQRWTDHWQVKALVLFSLFCLTTMAGGGTWLVGRAVANESKNVEQDQRLNSYEKTMETLGINLGQKIDKLDTKVEKLDDKLEAIRDRK